MKKSTLFNILTWVFAAITVLVALYVVFVAGVGGNKVLVLIPGAASLVCSNLTVRFRSEGK